MLSQVCEAFHCLPDEAERQDWGTVQRVLEYRAFEGAVTVFRRGKAGIATFQQHPELLDLIVALRKAQLGELPGVDLSARILDSMSQQPDPAGPGIDER